MPASHAAPARSKPAVLSAPWIIGLAGAGALVALLVLAIGLVGGGGQHPRQIPAPVDVAGMAASSVPDPRVSTQPTATSRQSPTAAPVRTRTPSRAPSGEASRPATTASLQARYRVRDTYRNSFVGEVTITNPAATASGWVVRLVFSSEVTGLRDSGLDTGPAPTVGGSANSWTFTSGTPLAAGQSVVLWAQFTRGDGRSERPSVCTVNGVACG